MTTKRLLHGDMSIPLKSINVLPEIVVWISDAFDDNIEKDFRKYLKESCWSYPDKYFSIKYLFMILTARFYQNHQTAFSHEWGTRSLK